VTAPAEPPWRFGLQGASAPCTPWLSRWIEFNLKMKSRELGFIVIGYFLLTPLAGLQADVITITRFLTGCRCIPYTVIDSIFQVEEGAELNWFSIDQDGGTHSGTWSLDSVDVDFPGIFITSIVKRNWPNYYLEAYKDEYAGRGTALFERDTDGLFVRLGYLKKPYSEPNPFDYSRNGGWVKSLALDYIWVGYFPWIYSLSYGWMYSISSTAYREEDEIFDTQWDWTYGGISYYIWSESYAEWVWYFLPLDILSPPSNGFVWSYSLSSWFAITDYWPAQNTP